MLSKTSVPWEMVVEPVYWMPSPERVCEPVPILIDAADRAAAAGAVAQIAAEPAIRRVVDRQRAVAGAVFAFGVLDDAVAGNAR